MEFIKMSDFDPTTNPNYNPPGSDGDGNGGGLGNGQGGGSADANNVPGGDGDGNGGVLGDCNGMNINGTVIGTDPTDPNYNPPGGDGDGEGNGDGNGEGNEGAGDGSNLPGGDGDGNGGGLGDGNGMNTNGAGNISEDSGNTNNLPADGSILLLSEQIGMIDANVYLFKNTEDGVSLERLNKADPAVDNEYVGSGGIYELTDSSDAELIQQISAANGSDNHLVYEEASIVAETETILYHAYYDLQHDVHVESMQDGFYVPSADYLFAASMVSGFRSAKIDIIAEFDVDAEELNRSYEQDEYSANEIFVIISDADNPDINGGYQLSSKSYKGDLQFYTDYYQSNSATQWRSNQWGYDGG